jgi:hypothetical protein
VIGQFLLHGRPRFAESGIAGFDHPVRSTDMNNAHYAVIGEQELAELNARAEASLVDDDAAWDEAVRSADEDCASLCDSLLANAGDYFD